MSMNYYEMLGLPCEGKSVDDVKIIERALIQWEKTKSDAKNNESSEAKRRALEEELRELPEMQRLMTDAALRKKHADELKSIRLAQLDPIIDVMSKSGSSEKSIARARVEKIANQIGLLPATAIKKFKDKGYDVIATKPANTSDFILADMVRRKIDGDFELIRAYMQSHPGDLMQDLVKASSLYEYIAIMDGKCLADAVEYEHKATEELGAMFAAKMSEHVKNAEPIRYYKDMEAQAKTQVFGDDKQREKYNNALKLKTLQSLFDMLRQVPDSIKLERTFAEECIKVIQREFSDEDQAIAIYNKYGELPTDSPFEKESIQVATMCAGCHVINYHDTLQIAQKENCNNCGKPLFRKCSKCGKLTPAIADFCSCGFFMKGTQTFELHFQRFSLAVTDMNMEKAQEALAHAKASNPSDERIPSMEKRLQQLVEDVGKPIREIEMLISSGRINAAQNALKRLQASRPNADLKQYQEQIQSELSWANQEFVKCQQSANEGAALEKCVEIVTRVTDYAPGLEWLRLHRPKPVMKVNGVSDAENVSCTLQWTDDPNNRFVTYTVIRKENARPVNVKDGVELAKSLKTQVFKDTALEPGRVYAYAIFAIRGDAASEPAHMPNVVCVFKGINSVHVNVSKNVCTLSWDDIKGSKGVRVLRSENSGRDFSVISDCSRAIFSDTRIKNGSEYRYALQTVWDVKGKVYYSQPLTRDVRIEQKPLRVDIKLNKAGTDGHCEVVWEPIGNGALRLIALKEGINVVPDQVYGDEQMRNMGQQIVSAVSVSAGKYAWYAQTGKKFRVASFRMFGDEAVCSVPIEISTVPPLRIDEIKTRIINNRLQLVLEAVPEGITKLHYLVSPNDVSVSEESAKRNATPSIDISTYRRAGMILVEDLPESELTVSILAMYGTGVNAYTSPVTKYVISNLPKQRITYRIEWQVTGFRRKPIRKGAKLIVMSGGNRIPEMSLCCRQDGNMIFNYLPGGSGIVELAHVAACATRPGKEIIVDLDEDMMAGIPANTDVQLFLAPKEANWFMPPMATIVASRKMPAP